MNVYFVIIVIVAFILLIIFVGKGKKSSISSSAVSFSSHTVKLEAAGKPVHIPGMVPIEEIKMQSQEGQLLFEQLKSVYYSGDNKKAYEYKDKIDVVRNSQDRDYIEALYTDLLSRIVLVGGSKGLKLLPNEECLFSDKNCGVYTIQKLNKNLTYCGIRNDINGFRTGVYTVNYLDVEGFRMSLFGRVYLTNKRIVIMGENKNMVIPIEKVMSYSLYETNGVLLNIENQNSVVLDLITNGNFENTSLGLFFHDTKYGFLYALDRAMSE